MNEDIRRAVRIELAKRDMTQTDLADLIGRTRQQVNQALRGNAAKIPDIWHEIASALGKKIIMVDDDGTSE